MNVEASLRPQHYVDHRAVRSRLDRADGRRERELLPRLVVAADVVEVPAPQGGGRLGLHPPRLLRSRCRSSRSSRPTTRPSATAISSTRRRKRVHLFHEGRFVGPFVYPYKFTFDLETLPARLHRRPHEAAAAPLLLPRRRLRVLGPDARPTSTWSARPKDGTMFLLGTDRLGPRPVLAHHLRRADLADHRPRRHRRVVHARHRSSAASPAIIGGWVDHVIQRLIEILRSLPELPLWLALSAALPANWSPILVFFGITIILGLLDWPGLARAVRSKLLSLREEDFVQRGRADGRLEAAHHRPPPDPELHEPPDRLGDAVDPVDDPRRDRAVLPRPRPAAARSRAGACCSTRRRTSPPCSSTRGCCSRSCR